jgi:hypothetical protein
MKSPPADGGVGGVSRIGAGAGFFVATECGASARGGFVVAGSGFTATGAGFGGGMRCSISAGVGAFARFAVAEIVLGGGAGGALLLAAAFVK